MKNSGQHREWISGVRLRFVSAALALAVAVSTAVVATPSAQTQTFTLLYSFQGGTQDGWVPHAKLVFDESGNLYGTTLTVRWQHHRGNRV